VASVGSRKPPLNDRPTDSSVNTRSTLSRLDLVWPHSPRLLVRRCKSATVSPGLARANETAMAGLDGGWDKSAMEGLAVSARRGHQIGPEADGMPSLLAQNAGY
jgi:hypothetical protein